MSDKVAPRLFNVLFLCTGNSARSIMAECILRRLGQGRFNAFSAGSHPAGKVNRYALELLQKLNHPIDGLRSKDWEEFAQPGAPEMDFVFTVCDRAAGEVCPVWPGQPMTAHWGFPDPAHFQGTEPEKRALFADVYGQIHNRLSIFVSLPLVSVDRLSLKKRLDELGQRAPQPA
jgi:protein-tyrosine-phosphatase